MTEAASAVVSFAFDAAGLHRIGLEAAPGNKASIRVAEKLGFQREGLQREAGRAVSGWLDLWLFGLLHGDPRLFPPAVEILRGAVGPFLLRQRVPPAPAPT